MFSPSLAPLTSSTSSLSFPSYVDAQDPAKILARAQQELNIRYLQERFMAPPLIGGPQGQLLPGPLLPHFFNRDHFPIVPPFLAGPVAPLSSTSGLAANPYPASTKLSSLQGQKQLNSLLQGPNASNFSSYLVSHLSGPQLPIIPPAPLTLGQKDMVGAFQAKSFPSSTFNPFFNPLNHLLLNQHSKDRERPNSFPKKPSRWSIAHVRIAWEIHMDQQRKIQSSSSSSSTQKAAERREDISDPSAVNKFKAHSSEKLCYSSKKRRFPSADKDLSKNSRSYPDVEDDSDVATDDAIPEKRKFSSARVSHDHLASPPLSILSPLPPHKPHDLVTSKCDKMERNDTNPRQHSLSSDLARPDSKKGNESSNMASIFPAKSCSVLVNGSMANERSVSNGETLLSLLKANDIYPPIPGVVPSISNPLLSVGLFPPRPLPFPLNL